MGMERRQLACEATLAERTRSLSCGEPPDTLMAAPRAALHPVTVKPAADDYAADGLCYLDLQTCCRDAGADWRCRGTLQDRAVGLIAAEQKASRRLSAAIDHSRLRRGQAEQLQIVSAETDRSVSRPAVDACKACRGCCWHVFTTVVATGVAADHQ